jgi:hypothetical protein
VPRGAAGDESRLRPWREARRRGNFPRMARLITRTRVDRPRGRPWHAGVAALCVSLGASLGGCGSWRHIVAEPAPGSMAPALDPATGDTVTATAVGMFGRPLGAAVRVRFRPASSLLVARRRDGESEEQVLDGVRELTGRLRASRGDTLFLAVSAVSDARGRMVFPGGEDELWWVRVQRAPDVRIDLLSRNPTRTELVANTVVIGVVWAGLGVAVACLVTRCGED